MSTESDATESDTGNSNSNSMASELDIEEDTDLIGDSSLRIGFEKISALGDKYWVPNVPDCKRPVNGMSFDSLGDAWNFYKEYAIVGGFEPIKSTQNPLAISIKNGGIVSLKIFRCAKYGKNGNSNKPVDTLKVVDDVNISKEPNVGGSGSFDDNNIVEVKKVQKRKSSSKKTGCHADIRLKLIANKYYVYTLREEHNHLLVHPDYITHFNVSRKVNFSKKRLLHKMNEASVGAAAGHRILTKVCGTEEVGFSKLDAKNYKRDVLAFIGNYDCQMVVELLNKRKDSVSDFSFDYLLDPDNRLGGFFWADEQSKRNYLAFGDVLSFDATYMTNKYDMVFIPFTGIDNHKKCVIFGAGMLSKENVVSYKWLCNAFIKAYPSQPKLVLTDQDPAMKIAINSSFTMSRYRLCMWHIMDKVTSKVSVAVCNDGFKPKLSRIVWTDKLDAEVFDLLWHGIIAEFSLEDNNWLCDMFRLRNFWIPAYFRDWEFSGLMRTSSRSESENHMFNQLMNSSSTLVEFLTHFDTAMYEQRFTQSKNDHESSYTAPIMTYDWVIENEAARIFTRSIFDDLSFEIGYAIKKCMSISFVDADGLKKFKIMDTSVVSMLIDDSIDRVNEPTYFDEFFPVESEVVYNASSEEVTCTCKRYERFGLLCRHIFYALRICKVTKFPRKYVCKRWTKNVVPLKICLGTHNSATVSPEDLGLSHLISKVYFNIELALDKVMGNKQKLVKFLKAQEKLLQECENEFDASDQMGNNEFISQMLGIEQPESVEIHAPQGIRNKGSMLKKRITSSREKAISKSQKTGRKCGYCSSYDQHNIRTCPERIIVEEAKKKAHVRDDGAGCSQVAD